MKSFQPGQCIVVGDGSVRTVVKMAAPVGNEPLRVEVEGGLQWLAADCDAVEPITNQEIPELADRAARKLVHFLLTEARNFLGNGEIDEAIGDDKDAQRLDHHTRGLVYGLVWDQLGRAAVDYQPRNHVLIEAEEIANGVIGWEWHLPTLHAICERLRAAHDSTPTVSASDRVAAIAARVAALPVSGGGGRITASRDEVLRAIDGTTQPAEYTRTSSPIICCGGCGAFPVEEEHRDHGYLRFVGDQKTAEAACIDYLTIYRGWTFTGTAAETRCDNCVGGGSTSEG